MIGTAIKKYAAAHGMTCDGGLAYGRVNGYHISLEDGSGVKILQIYLYPPAEGMECRSETLANVQQILKTDAPREYRLAKQNPVTVTAGRAVVLFHDSIHTISRIERYIDEVLPQLGSAQLDVDVCAYCGQPLNGDVRYALLDDSILPVHSGCVGEMSAQVDSDEDRPRSGSILKGALGALLGAAIGAIPWAVVFMLGYVASIAGLLIGYLSNYFYGKFGGKHCKARVAIVVLALILGVLLGQVAGDMLMFSQMYDEEGGFEELDLNRGQFIKAYYWDQLTNADQTKTLSDVYAMLVGNFPDEDFVTEEEFISNAWDSSYGSVHAELVKTFSTNFAMGLFFGVLGCFSLFVRLNKETGKRRVKLLKA